MSTSKQTITINIITNPDDTLESVVQVEDNKAEAAPEQKRINTSKVLNNNYFSGDGISEEYFAPQKTMALSPLISDQYDYSITEDIVLLTERKDTAELLYKIYENSPYKGKFLNHNNVIKIPRDAITEIFYYTRKELLKYKSLSAMEIVIAINEFYELNYDYVYNKVLSPKMKQEILDDYYNNHGMRDRMDQAAAEPLF